ncbi:MAG TPA: glycosyltransferase family 4 protein [Chloroflexia bacterium]|nr:glycosyltransferase family 4 protein [Chloroflexia bacterium]
MNIVICHSQVPYVRGGAEVLLDGLIAALREEGHHVALVSLPFKWYPRAQLEQQALAWRMLDLNTLGGRTVDMVICTKFPTWAVQHSRKVIWLVHQHRQAYDWYGTPLSDFGLSEEDQRARRVVLETDSTGIGEARGIYTISRNVANRLARYTGLGGQALYPPTQHDRYYHEEYGDYIFSISRLDSAKRIDLLLAALKKSTSGVRAIIAGNGPDAEKLQARAAELGLKGRVEFTGRVSDEEAIKLYAGALAVFYAPVDEDYGYVTVEAMRSRKPVLTAPDSGGVLEFVDDGVNGYICPDPAAFAAAMDRLYRDKNRELAARLGTAGYETARQVPTWREVAQTLTGSAGNDS